MLDPADFHLERFYCQLRSLAHASMVMKAGLFRRQGRGGSVKIKSREWVKIKEN
jgi:hypothetical protein